MPNQTFALEWLGFSKKHLLTARLLIREKHFTDSIAIEIQQAIEKSLKAVFAYWGDPIPKTHSLMNLFRYAVEKMNELNNVDKDDILSISDYYENDRYPGPRYEIPERDEVEYYFSIAEFVFEQIQFAITNRHGQHG